MANNAIQASTIPVTFSEQTGVDLHMYDRVLFAPGANMWGYNPAAEVEGTYLGWKRDGEQLVIKIDVVDKGGFLRFTPPIENVWRIWDARDDEIAALRTELKRTRIGFIHTAWIDEDPIIRLTREKHDTL